MEREQKKIGNFFTYIHTHTTHSETRYPLSFPSFCCLPFHTRSGDLVGQNWCLIFHRFVFRYLVFFFVSLHCLENNGKGRREHGKKEKNHGIWLFFRDFYTMVDSLTDVDRLDSQRIESLAMREGYGYLYSFHRFLEGRDAFACEFRYHCITYCIPCVPVGPYIPNFWPDVFMYICIQKQQTTPYWCPICVLNGSIYLSRATWECNRRRGKTFPPRGEGV